MRPCGVLFVVKRVVDCYLIGLSAFPYLYLPYRYPVQVGIFSFIVLVSDLRIVVFKANLPIDFYLIIINSSIMEHSMRDCLFLFLFQAVPLF